ncbi:hypothetical protein [uncultured Ruminococcus sp.]|uniref:hypothetical protein n=1 Tax=uncultured Ruminococcus sp. TaxID=165186 RepID=UPI00342B2E63
MLIILVSNSKYLVGIIRVFTCSVYLQLYAEISNRIVSVKYGLRLPPIFVDTAAFVHLVMVTVTAIIVAVKVIGIILMEQGITAAAPNVVVMVT